MRSHRLVILLNRRIALGIGLDHYNELRIDLLCVVFLISLDTKARGMAIYGFIRNLIYDSNERRKR